MRQPEPVRELLYVIALHELLFAQTQQRQTVHFLLEQIRACVREGVGRKISTGVKTRDQHKPITPIRDYNCDYLV